MQPQVNRTLRRRHVWPASVWPRTKRPASVISCTCELRFLAPNRLLDFDSFSDFCSCGSVMRRNSNIISSVGSRSMRAEVFSSDGLRPRGVSTTVSRLSVSGVPLTRVFALGSSVRKTSSRSNEPVGKRRFFFGSALRDAGVSCCLFSSSSLLLSLTSICSTCHTVQAGLVLYAERGTKLGTRRVPARVNGHPMKLYAHLVLLRRRLPFQLRQRSVLGRFVELDALRHAFPFLNGDVITDAPSGLASQQHVHPACGAARRDCGISPGVWRATFNWYRLLPNARFDEHFVVRIPGIRRFRSNTR